MQLFTYHFFMHFTTIFTHCPACGSHKFVQYNEKSKKCESCAFIYYINPSAAVAAFIVNGKDELLVCKRAKNPEKGTWDLPGGFVDFNETAEEAVVREIKEETQLEVATINYCYTLPNEYEYSGLTVPTLDVFYLCSVKDTNNLKAADDVEECFFVPINELNADSFGLLSIRKGVSMFINSKKTSIK